MSCRAKATNHFAFNKPLSLLKILALGSWWIKCRAAAGGISCVAEKDIFSKFKHKLSSEHAFACGFFKGHVYHVAKIVLAVGFWSHFHNRPTQQTLFKTYRFGSKLHFRSISIILKGKWLTRAFGAHMHTQVYTHNAEIKRSRPLAGKVAAMLH